MFVDTSGLYCFFDESDQRNRKAVDLIQTTSTRITTSYVLAEFIPLCYSRNLDKKKTLEFTSTLLTNPLIEIIWVDENLHREAFALLQKRPDKTYSLCDAVSFMVMRETGIAEALTTDKHFEQEGLIRLLK